MRRLFIASTLLITTATAFIACSDSTGVSSTTYIAAMNGANERPTPNTSAATGTATYILTGNSLSYTIVVNGLTVPASGAHLHVGGPSVSGPIVVPYTVSATQSGTVTAGTIDLSFPIVSGGSSITGDSLKALLNNGNAYANVHNPSFPGGEIRGQVIRQ